MKKILALSCFCFLSALSVFSQPENKADELLAGLSSRIAAMQSYRVEFTVYAEESVMQGGYVVSGRNFKITTSEFEVIGDGKSRYEVNHALKEVVVDIMDTTDVNILINPTRAFEFAQGGFVSSYGGTAELGDQISDFVVLTPAAVGSSINQVKLYISRETGLPARLEYRLAGLADKITVEVSSFHEDFKLRPADIRFRKADYPDYEIVDFR